MPVRDEKLHDLYAEVLNRNPGEAEFHQAVHEVLDSLGQRADGGYQRPTRASPRLWTSPRRTICLL